MKTPKILGTNSTAQTGARSNQSKLHAKVVFWYKPLMQQ
jgi:hypothetical protein